MINILCIPGKFTYIALQILDQDRGSLRHSIGRWQAMSSWPEEAVLLSPAVKDCHR